MKRCRSGLPTGRTSAGFAYLWVLLLVVVTGLALGIALDVHATAVRRDKERELLAIGRRHFEESYLAPRMWLVAWAAPAWRLTKPALKAYTRFTRMVWVLERPRRS